VYFVVIIFFKSHHKMSSKSGVESSRREVKAALLAEIVRRIVEVASPDRIIMFGSGARGEMKPDSDLDFLVIKAGVEHRRKLVQQVYLNLFGITVPVDVIVVTPEDAEQSRKCIGTIIGPAMQDGIEVYAA
jgi:predicted nucleotidyltransferase